MPAEITTPDGRKVRTDHLPFGVIAQVAKDADTNWAHVVDAPVLGDGFVMVHLYRAACEHTGQDVPKDLDARTLPKCFEIVDDDDLPTEFEAGLPDPQPPESPAEGSSATT